MSAPELQLTKEDAEEYAEAVAMVARHYDIGASAKTLDWINLCTTMSGIYGVRFITIAARRKARREGRPVSGPVPNGGDAPPAAEEAPAGAVDWSLMRGRPN